MVIRQDVAGRAACNTWRVNRTEIVDRWNAGFAALRRATSPLPRLSRWAWAADAVLAFGLLVGTVNGALSRDDGTSSAPAAVVPLTPAGVPLPPPAPPALPPHYSALPPPPLNPAL